MQTMARSLCLLLILLTLLVPQAIRTTSAAGPTVNVWLTTADKTKLLQRQPAISFGPAGAAPLAIAVNEYNRYQRMEGFGAAMTDSSAWLIANALTQTERDALMRKLFSRQGGIGLSALRLPMGSSDFTAAQAHYTYDDMPAGQTDPTLANFSIAHDQQYIIPALKQALALNPQLRIMASPWSAPGWMKTTDALVKGSLKPEYYDEYARYFVRFIKAYQAQGVPIRWVTPQNEPQYEPDNYPGMRMSPAEQAAFIEQLGPALRTARLSTGIVAFDHNWALPYYGPEVLSDTQANPYVVGTAFHCYGGQPSYQTITHDTYPTKGIFFTECSSGAWSSNWADNFKWDLQNLVIGATRYWAKTVIKWNLALDTSYGPYLGGCSNCTGFVTIDQQTDTVAGYNHDYYAIGHASKFVLPGAYRIASTDASASGLDNVAFVNPDGSKALLVLNSSAGEKTFSVRWGQQSFSYSLPAGAAATFTWGGAPVVTAKPRRVQGLQASAGNGQVKLTWGFSPLARSYVVKRATSATGPYAQLGGVLRVPEYVDKAVANGTTYFYTVQAANQYGVGAPATPASATPNTGPLWDAAQQIEAESFDAQAGIGIEECGDVSGCGRNIAYTEENDYVHWSRVDFGDGGLDNAIVRYGTNSTGGSVELRLDELAGTLIGTVPLEHTCGWGRWTTVSAPLTTAVSGTHELYAVFKGVPPKDGIANVNWFSFGAEPTGRISRAGWTATASSSAAQDPVENALNDSDCTNRWSSGTGQAAGQYFQVDMGALHTFDQVTLDAGSGSGDYPRAWKLEVSANGADWTEVTSGSGRSANVLIKFEPVAARYIKITLTGSSGSWWSIANLTAELTGEGAPDDSGQLSRDAWTATASSVPTNPCCTMDVPSHAIDGDPGTRWTSGQGQAPGDWFQVDLGAAQSFNKLELDAMGGDYPRGYELYVSADGATWGSPVATGAGSAVTTITFPTQTARYFRIVQTGSSGSWWSLHELYAYLVDLDSAGWTATASSSPTICCQDQVPSQAIDGDLGTRWSSGQGMTPGDWFQIDLGAAQSFSRVVLDSGSSSGDFAPTYELYVSSDGAAWGSPVASGVGSAVTTISFAPQTARYIKVVQTGSSGSWWSIHEITVYP